jgi:hypothetical protein
VFIYFVFQVVTIGDLAKEGQIKIQLYEYIFMEACFAVKKVPTPGGAGTQITH